MPSSATKICPRRSLSRCRRHRRRRHRRLCRRFPPLSALNTFPSVYEVSPLTKCTKALRPGRCGRQERLLLKGHRGVIQRVDPKRENENEGDGGVVGRDRCDDHMSDDGGDLRDRHARARAGVFDYLDDNIDVVSCHFALVLEESHKCL